MRFDFTGGKTTEEARVLKKCPECGKVLGERRITILSEEDPLIIGDLFDDGFTGWVCDCGWEGRPQEAKQEIIRKEVVMPNDKGVSKGDVEIAQRVFKQFLEEQECIIVVAEFEQWCNEKVKGGKDECKGQNG